MNRRRVLQGVGVGSVVGLAGCLDGIREHFGLTGNVPIEITNEGTVTHSVTLNARERGSGRESYDQSMSVTPGERAAPPHVPQSDQQFRVSVIEDSEAVHVETADITSSSQFVRIWLYDDRIELEVREREDEGSETGDDVGDDPGNATDGD